MRGGLTYEQALNLNYEERKLCQKIIKENIDFMYNEDNSKELPVLKSYLTNLDKIRGTDFKKTFLDLPL